MNFKALLNSIILCAFPAASQYTVDTIPGITYIHSMKLVNDALYLNAQDSGCPGSLSVVRNGVKTLLWPGTNVENGPIDFIGIADKVYYCFNDQSTGVNGEFFNSLWVIDSTTSVSKLVSERVGEPAAFGKRLYFRKYDDSTGYELWTYIESEGSRIVADLNPGSGFSYPTNITYFKRRILFFANLPGYGFELFISDGTVSGTRLVKDIYPGPKGCVKTFPKIIDGVSFDIVKPVIKFTECNGSLYFLANDSTHGLELWRLNGADYSASIVKDINPGVGSAFNEIDSVNQPPFCVFNNILYFVSDNGINGKELWRTNGTDTGTYMIKDINPGSASSDITEFEINYSHIYFAADNGINGLELWRTDGTIAGTTLFADIQPQIGPSFSSFPRELTTHVDGKLYFTTQCAANVPYDSTVMSIYRVNGKLGTIEKILDFPPYEFTDSSHMLVASLQGLFFRSVNPYGHNLCRLCIFDKPVIFTSIPVTNALVGTEYVYKYKVTDPDGQPIFLESAALPTWLTFYYYGDGTGELKGIPPFSANFKVVLSATTNSPSPAVTQSFTIVALDSIESVSLRAYSYEEMRNAQNQSNPRIYFVNEGVASVSSFSAEYYFYSEGGKTPVLERYYVPDFSVSLDSMGDNLYKIVYIYTGKPIPPGGVIPNTAGIVVGIHNSDYSSWDKTDDYSNNLSPVFSENNRICIYYGGTRIFGIPPFFNNAPVAIAGNSITVVDEGGDGENIPLDGSSSYDTDGSIVSYEWSVNGVLAATGKTGSVNLREGIYTVILKVVDDDSAVGMDTVVFTVLAAPSTIVFTLSSDPVLPDQPVILRYSVPAALAGATIRYTAQRLWGPVSGSLIGERGTFSYQFWEWNKSFFGGSGPWQLTIEVNGKLAATKQIRFSY